MKINLNWLREWVVYDESAERLAEELTTAGLEIDSVTQLNVGLEEIVVARVEAIKKHPQADRLKVCQVNDGSQVHEVVCGAPNVVEDCVVPFAPVGASLPGGQKIRATKLRGVLSSGMLCSGKELGISDDSDGLLLLDPAATLGQKLVAFLDLDDAVLDIDLTPNRGDCFSVLGVAREVAARHGKELRGPAFGNVANEIQKQFPIASLAPAACPKICGRLIQEVDNQVASPLWLQERLRRAGLRPINPIVDVTNYVMLELGQPLHAYDVSKLNEKVTARYAQSGEQLVLLNDKAIELDSDVLVIADAQGPIGLAGIMGGASTATSEATTEVLFEAAFFAPDAIAGRARRYALHTDASVRFERGVDPAGQERAIERATKLLVKIAGGRAGPVNIAAAASNMPQRPAIELRKARLEAVLGIALDAADVSIMLNRLGMSVEALSDGWRVVPPSFRFDVNIEADLIEEVGRMVGYDQIPATAGSTVTHLRSMTETRVDRDLVCDVLVDRGFYEIITYSFIDERIAEQISPGRQFAELANPIASDMSVMRRSLWPGLLETARKNHAHQADDLRLFEIGPRFDEKLVQTNVVAGLAVGRYAPETWDSGTRKVDFFDLKSDVEVVLALSGQLDEFSFTAAEHPALRPGQTARIERSGIAVGWIGALHPQLQKDLDLRGDVFLFSLRMEESFAASVPKFRVYSNLPHIRRDLAVVVDEQLTAQSLIDNVKFSAGPLLKDVIVFDVYRGKGIDATRKSIALGLILQDASRTLTDGDADEVVLSVTQSLQRDLDATIRT